MLFCFSPRKGKHTQNNAIMLNCWRVWRSIFRHPSRIVFAVSGGLTRALGVRAPQSAGGAAFCCLSQNPAQAANATTAILPRRGVPGEMLYNVLRSLPGSPPLLTAQVTFVNSR